MWQDALHKHRHGGSVCCRFSSEPGGPFSKARWVLVFQSDTCTPQAFGPPSDFLKDSSVCLSRFAGNLKRGPTLLLWCSILIFGLLAGAAEGAGDGADLLQGAAAAGRVLRGGGADLREPGGLGSRGRGLLLHHHPDDGRRGSG